MGWEGPVGTPTVPDVPIVEAVAEAWTGRHENAPRQAPWLGASWPTPGLGWFASVRYVPFTKEASPSRSFGEVLQAGAMRALWLGTRIALPRRTGASVSSKRVFLIRSGGGERHEVALQLSQSRSTVGRLGESLGQRSTGHVEGGLVTIRPR